MIKLVAAALLAAMIQGEASSQDVVPPKVGESVLFFRTCVDVVLPEFVPYWEADKRVPSDAFAARKVEGICQEFRGGMIRSIQRVMGHIETPAGLRWIVQVYESTDGRTWFAITDPQR